MAKLADTSLFQLGLDLATLLPHWGQVVSITDVYFLWTADALISTGLAHLGYIYVNIGNICAPICFISMESLGHICCRLMVFHGR